MRRERKVVTVLFVDLVGFTARAEAMDPEDVEAELTGYHEHVRRELEHFGGTVEKFIGDAVMAVFGAPIAHEDDAERAVRAALAVRDWATSDGGLEIRIGVNTGEALVRLDARADAGEGIAVGDVVNTASRLQSAAPTDGVLVGESTYRITNSRIEYRPADDVDAKGKSQPVKVWVAVDARSRFGTDVEQAPRTHFVGRDNEMGLLRGSLTRARELREPQLVTLVGVPGIGKSRMVYELSRIVDAEPDLVMWRQGRCLPYGDGVSLWALAEMVKAQAGILESDPPDLADEKLVKTVETVIVDGDTEWIATRLRPLVGLATTDAPQATREEQFSAWRRFLEALAEEQPAVLVFEDLHWADDNLLDFLDELTDLTTGVPLFIVCTARPELMSKRPGWGAGRTNALTLSLPPLSTDSTAMLVKDLVESTLSSELQQSVLERADGNPLYAEEFARMLAERTTVDLVVPDSVQGIIAARLDTLTVDQKRLVQHAAVVGKVFWAGVLATLGDRDKEQVESALRDLERRELVRRERRSSVASDTEYAFRHILVRDVAYGQIPRADRSELHRRTAEWIAALGRPDDYAELIAHHYLAALDYARAASRDTSSFDDAARQALRDAGDRATSLGAAASAAQFFRAALDLATDDVERAELLIGYGTAQWLADGTGLDSLTEGARGLEQLGRYEEAAEAFALVGRSESLRGQAAEAEQWLAEADRLIEQAPQSPARYKILFVRAGMNLGAGHNTLARDLVEPELANIEKLGRPDLLARALDIYGSSRASLGDPSGADDQWRAVRIARESKAIWELQVALNNLTATLTWDGRLREVRDVLAIRQETFDTFGGSAETRAWFVAALAASEYFEGAWDDALAHLDHVLRSMPTMSAGVIGRVVRPLRARILVARDLAYDPRLDLASAITFATTTDQGKISVDSLSATAEVLELAGISDEAAALWSEAARQVAAGGKSECDDETITFVWTAVHLGREDEALRAMETMPANTWLSAAHEILTHEYAAAADHLFEIGHLPAAADANLHAGGDRLHRALAFYRSVGATRFIQRAEAAL